MKVLDEICPSLSNNPSLGEKLNGDLLGYYSYHFTYSGSEYRIAFELIEEEKVMYFIKVAPRQNFYQDLKRFLN